MIELHEWGLVFIEVLQDLESVLSNNKNFLLGIWLESAKALAANEDERKLYEFNARNQLTLWGPNGEILDYAGKQWSGLLADYYIPRWKMFFKALEKALITGTKFNKTTFRNQFLKKLGKPFCQSHKVYPTNPKGDTVDLAFALYQKWSKVFNEI